MRMIGNFIWFVFGGVFMGLAWWIIGVIAFLSIVGIPWGRACFVIGNLSFFPFGKEAISRYELTLANDVGTGGFGVLGNIIWFIVAGIWLAICHLTLAVGWTLTIVGIPFAIAHLKLAGISLAPIGKTVVDKELASAAREENARSNLTKMRRAT